MRNLTRFDFSPTPSTARIFTITRPRSLRTRSTTLNRSPPREWGQEWGQASNLEHFLHSSFTPFQNHPQFLRHSSPQSRRSTYRRICETFAALFIPSCSASHPCDTTVRLDRKSASATFTGSGPLLALLLLHCPPVRPLHHRQPFPDCVLGSRVLQSARRRQPVRPTSWLQRVALAPTAIRIIQ